LAIAISRRTNDILRRYPLEDLLGVRLPILLVLLVPLFAPQLLPSSRLLSLAVTAAIFVIVANGLHVVFSYTGQLSLAQSTLWGLGAYTGALLVVHYGWPTFALFPVAGVVAAIGAVAIGIPAFRTAGFSFAIITFAFAEIMILVGNNWDRLTNGNLGLLITTPPTPLGPIKFDTIDQLPHFYYLSLALAYISIAGIFVIRQSKLGRTFIAIRENEALARSLGINVYLHKLIALGISGFFAGVAGVLLMYQNHHVQPSQFSAFVTIQFLLMILIGGRLSMLGPAIGAVVAMFGPELINSIFGNVIDFTRQQIIFGGLLALAVLTAPNGIAGQTRDGYRTFFAVLRRSRAERHGWPRSVAFAFVCSVAPGLAQRFTRAEGSD